MATRTSPGSDRLRAPFSERKFILADSVFHVIFHKALGLENFDLCHFSHKIARYLDCGRTNDLLFNKN